MSHEIIGFQWMTLLLLFTICFSSCKDDKDASAEPYDPSQPVTVTDFAPKAGGANTRMIIYGSNFGTDSSIVFVKIGGKEAKVINAKGNSLYCITPQQCYEGTIEVKRINIILLAALSAPFEHAIIIVSLLKVHDMLRKRSAPSELPVIPVYILSFFKSNIRIGLPLPLFSAS